MMYWTDIERSNHYDLFHKGVLDWEDVIQLIHSNKKKRKKGNKIDVEDKKFYILCELNNRILYVINVKKK